MAKWKTTGRRALALFISLMMCLGALPATALAGDLMEEPSPAGSMEVQDDFLPDAVSEEDAGEIPGEVPGESSTENHEPPPNTPSEGDSNEIANEMDAGEEDHVFNDEGISDDSLPEAANLFVASVEADVVAVIGDQPYTSLQDAINAAANGNTVVLKVSSNEYIIISEKSLTLQIPADVVLGNHEQAAITVTNGGKLRVTGAGTVNGAVAEGSGTQLVINMDGGLVDGGLYNDGTNGIGITVKDGAKVFVMDGTVTGDRNGIYTEANSLASVNGGTVTVRNSNEAIYNNNGTVQVVDGKVIGWKGITSTGIRAKNLIYGGFVGYIDRGIQSSKSAIRLENGASLTVFGGRIHGAVSHMSLAGYCTIKGGVLTAAHMYDIDKKVPSGYVYHLTEEDGVEVYKIHEECGTTEMTTQPTCTEDGKSETVCAKCGVVFESKVLPATGEHTPVTDAAVAPTCTEAGKTEGSHCSVCNMDLKAQEEVPALGHTVVTDASVAPTCTKTGLTAGSHCSVCEDVLTAQEAVAAIGHTVVTDAAVAPTYNSTGLTEGSHCSVCGEILAAQEVLPVLPAPSNPVLPMPAPSGSSGSTVPSTSGNPAAPTTPSDVLDTEIEDNDTPLARTPVATIFRDVTPNKWYVDAVQYVYDNGLMKGIGNNGTFAPNESVSRSMVATIIYRLANEPDTTFTAVFSDVASNDWYANAVTWGANNSIIAGINGMFVPGADVTREQAIVFLYRYAQMLGVDVSIVGDLSAFADSNLISDWAMDAMRWAVGVGLVEGSDGMLCPSDTLPRAELAQILKNFCENITH